MTTTQRLLFATLAGARVPSVTVAEMREVDRVATEATGPSLLQMIEIAGQQTALAAIDLLGDRWSGARALVLCGSGRNGATGVVAARHLAEAPARVTRWDKAFDVTAADVVIDAILGCRLVGEPQPVQRGLILAARAAVEAGVPVLSIDVPSGLEADGGINPGAVVVPTRTLTLALPKRGLTRASAGDLWVADLGVPPGVFARAGVAFAPFFGTATRVALEYPGE